MTRRRHSRTTSLAADHIPDAVETAWRIHQAQIDWTTRVDTKAGLAFTIESATIATTVTLSSVGHLFSSFDNWKLKVLYYGGLALLLLAAGLSAAVVTPRLRRTSICAESASNFIYFGHARLWQPDDLEAALKMESILPQLSKQIVVMARIAWDKHVKVQWSFVLAAAGAALLVACALLKTI